MKINLNKLYVVFKPRKNDEKIDIFSIEPLTLDDINLMFLGGLQAKDVHAIYTTVKEAKKEANVLFKKYNIKH